ncbi:MAG: hypothetical protein AB2665_18705 [Candidatus Thiodiazotropha sp.]
MKQQTVKLSEKTSSTIDSSGIIVSARTTYGSHCDIVIGYPGLPNVVKQMHVGDAVLYETPAEGVIEVRALSMNSVSVELLISYVSPRLGISAGFIDEDPNNSPFTSNELRQIEDSIEKAKLELAHNKEIEEKELEIISRKLDEIQSASNRLGRKDWINYVAGSMTSLAISAAFSPDTTKAVFISINKAFSWLFDNALVLLS